MTWVKLDDTMPTHPKVLAAGPMAFALDVAGICYSNKHATDGMIADCVLPAVMPGMPNPKKLAAKLVDVGRWVRVEGGWMIHDVHDYQPTAAEQKDISRKRAEAGRKGGSKSKRTSEATEKQVAKQVASVPDNPDPTRPDPEVQESASRKRSDQATRLPDGWQPSPEPDLVKAIGGQDAARLEFDKFCDYWKAKAGKDGRKLDWQATWRNWLRRASENVGVNGARKPKQDVVAASRGEGWR